MTTDDNRSRGAEEIYRNTPPAEIPWNNVGPPELLVELVESGQIKPCLALDLGCGLGNYAIWLAGKGFDVTGVDASPTAIEIAKQNAAEKKANCEFVVADVLGDWPDLPGPFGFVYDWGLLHHILPEFRERYVANVHRVLKPGGNYVSLCFNEKDAAFEGTGKLRTTQMKTTVYLSSQEELLELFERFFTIIDFRIFESDSKIMKHVFNYCFMERK